MAHTMHQAGSTRFKFNLPILKLWHESISLCERGTTGCTRAGRRSLQRSVCTSKIDPCFETCCFTNSTLKATTRFPICQLNGVLGRTMKRVASRIQLWRRQLDSPFVSWTAYSAEPKNSPTCICCMYVSVQLSTRAFAHRGSTPWCEEFSVNGTCTKEQKLFFR